MATTRGMQQTLNVFFQLVSKPWLMIKFCDMVYKFIYSGNEYILRILYTKKNVVITRNSFCSPKIYPSFIRWWGPPGELRSTKKSSLRL